MTTNEQFLSSKFLNSAFLNSQPLSTGIVEPVQPLDIQGNWARRSSFTVATEGFFTSNGNSNFVGDVNDPSDDALVYVGGATTLNGAPTFSTLEFGLSLGPSATLQNISCQLANQTVLTWVEQPVTVEIPSYETLKTQVLSDNQSRGEVLLNISCQPINTAEDLAAALAIAPAQSAVIRIVGGSLTIPDDTYLKNLTIIVENGDISFNGDQSLLENVELIAERGNINLNRLVADDVSFLASGSINLNQASWFTGESLLATQQGAVSFNGETVTVEPFDWVEVISNADIHINAPIGLRSNLWSNGVLSVNAEAGIIGSIKTKTGIVLNSSLDIVGEAVLDTESLISDAIFDFEAQLNQTAYDAYLEIEQTLEDLVTALEQLPDSIEFVGSDLLPIPEEASPNYWENRVNTLFNDLVKGLNNTIDQSFIDLTIVMNAIAGEPSSIESGSSTLIPTFPESPELPANIDEIIAEAVREFNSNPSTLFEQPFVGVIDDGGEHSRKIVETIIGSSVSNDSIWIGNRVGSGAWYLDLIDFVDAAQASGRLSAIANLSFELVQIDQNGNVFPRLLLTKDELEALAYAEENDILVIVAAGNSASSITAWNEIAKRFRNILVVGAGTTAGREGYSSYTGLTGILASGNLADSATGTSIAAANVTKAAQRILEANPELNPAQVIEQLINSAIDVGQTGIDFETGAGFLDEDAAVKLAESAIPEVYLPEGFAEYQQWLEDNRVPEALLPILYEAYLLGALSNKVTGEVWESLDGFRPGERVAFFGDFVKKVTDGARDLGNKAADFYNKNSDAIHTALDVAGYIPVVGTVADVVNAGLYAAKGDYVNAGLSLVSAVPGIGDAVGSLGKGGKAAAKALTIVNKAPSPTKLGKKLLSAEKAIRDEARAEFTSRILKAPPNKGTSFLRFNKPGQAFKNHASLNKHLKNRNPIASRGKQLEHIVEQSGITKFGSNKIHNTANAAWLDPKYHGVATRLYNSNPSILKNLGYKGDGFRQFVSQFSFDQQRKIKLDLYKELGLTVVGNQIIARSSAWSKLTNLIGGTKPTTAIARMILQDFERAVRGEILTNTEARAGQSKVQVLENTLGLNLQEVQQLLKVAGIGGSSDAEATKRLEIVLEAIQRIEQQRNLTPEQRRSEQNIVSGLGGSEFRGKYYIWEPYQVKSGDFLSRIALNTMGNGTAPYYNFIAAHNGIANPNIIYAGEIIEVPRELTIFTNPANGHKYFQTTASSWTETQSQAILAGGNLVTINDVAEQSWIQSTFGTNRAFWIGLTDSEQYGASEGNFRWVNGEPVTFTDWWPGEPNNVNMNGVDEDFVEIRPQLKWNDLANTQVRQSGIVEVQ